MDCLEQRHVKTLFASCPNNGFVVYLNFVNKYLKHKITEYNINSRSILGIILCSAGWANKKCTMQDLLCGYSKSVLSISFILTEMHCILKVIK